MVSSRVAAHVRRIREQALRGIGEDVERLRLDAGLSRAALGEAADVDPTYLGRIEDGLARPTMETWARLAVALGADLRVRLYPNTGPALRDRHQARILEALLRSLHHRWGTYPEVAVRQPARGRIDVVLHDPRASLLVAVEIQSALPRLEQLIRWSSEKAASIPSWEGYSRLGRPQAVSTLLVVRSTRATREIRRQFARQLEASYPAHPSDALASLRGDRPWPGPALVWADIRGDEVRLSSERAAA